MEKAQPQGVVLFRECLSNILSNFEYAKFPSFAAHTQVLKSFNINKFVEWIRAGGDEKKQKTRVTTALPLQNINLLHTCAMLGQIPYAEKVFELKILDPNATDRSGWSFLHFAAFIHDKVLFTLGLKHGAQPRMNIRGALPDKLEQLAYPSTGELPFRYRNESKQVVFGGKDDFRKLTGKELTDDIVISQEDLFKDWRDGKPSSSKASSQDLDSLSKFRQASPKLFIEKKPDVEWEVVTEEFIPAGAFICEYVGQYSPSYVENKGTEAVNNSSNSYRLNKIDGKKVCNMGPLANDGVPNALIITIPDCEGLEERYFLKALVDLPSGTIVRWDYGPVTVKCIAHKEISLDHLFSTYRILREKWGPLDVAQGKIQRKTEREKVSNKSNIIRSYDERLASLTLEETDFMQKVSYITNTPHALTLLVFSKTVPLQEVAGLFDGISRAHSNHVTFRKVVELLGLIKLESFSEQQTKDIINSISNMNLDTLFQYLLQLLPDENTLNKFVQKHFPETKKSKS